MFSLVQHVGTFGYPNDPVLSHEGGTPELSTVFGGQQVKVVNAWKSSSWLSSQTVPVVFAVVGSFPLSLSSSSFSPSSWDCSEFATGSLISKAMVNPSLKSFKLSANNPLLKLLARKLGWDRAWLTTPRFYFCSQIISSWSHFWLALEAPPTIAVEQWVARLCVACSDIS